MTYNKKILAKIGKQVVQSHPDIASGILKQLSECRVQDLTKINEYLKCYCLSLGIQPQSMKGPVYKSSITELKKVFISAMITIYNDQHLFNKTISQLLEQDASITTRIVREVQFRYKKDPDFTERVTNTIKIITDHKQKLAS